MWWLPARQFAGRPVDLACSPDGKAVVIKNKLGLVLVDADSWRVRLCSRIARPIIRVEGQTEVEVCHQTAVPFHPEEALPSFQVG